MDEIFIECSPGISGDMLLAAFYDLGVPKDIIEKPLIELGLKGMYTLSFIESKSSSIRGIKTEIKIKKDIQNRIWKNIKELILESELEDKLKKMIMDVFESLALAEGKVHGINPNDVHFHEIGSIDSILDIVGVCAAVNYLDPKKIYCNSPNLGQGVIQAEHGRISIPSPAVIELLTSRKFEVSSNCLSIDGELTTPTGMALLLNLTSNFKLPDKYSINSYGVGIGARKLSYPNLTRVLEVSSYIDNIENKNPKLEEITIQEAWIDDQSPEDISSFVQIMRDEGAYDVSFQAINMKKDRIGYSVTAIVPTSKGDYFRNLWFQNSNTIGLRERKQGRWILHRRRGVCMTAFGEIKFKQIMKINGEEYIKPENDEIVMLQKKYKKNAEDIRTIINKTMGKFEPFEDWE